MHAGSSMTDRAAHRLAGQCGHSRGATHSCNRGCVSLIDSLARLILRVVVVDSLQQSKRQTFDFGNCAGLLSETADGRVARRVSIPNLSLRTAYGTSSRRRSGRFPSLGPTTSIRVYARSFSKRPRSYPSQGRSNVGGWRSRNDLFHWEAPEVKEIGAWIMDCVRRIVEATAVRRNDIVGR